MTTGYLLSADEYTEFRKLIELSRKGLLVPPNRPHVPPHIDPAEETYIARVPSSGIRAFFAGVTGTGTLYDDQEISFAECDIYRIIEGNVHRLEEQVGLTKRVYNLNNYDIPPYAFVKIEKEKYGFWVAEYSRFDGPEEDGVDTGTGTGTSIDFHPCGEARVSVYRYRCEDGRLNEYRYYSTVEYDPLTGCLTVRNTEETFVQFIMCCDVSCDAETGTGTAVDTGTGTDPAQDTGTGGVGPGPPCCAGGIPMVLNAALTNLVSCPDLDGFDVTCTYNPGTGWWEGTRAVGGGKTVYVAGKCLPGSPDQWVTTLSCTAYNYTSTIGTTTWTCEPAFSVSLTVGPDGIACGLACSVRVDWTE